MRPAPLIVGAGPAGIRAAATLVAAGLRPVVVDEAPAPGGQIYRQPLVPDGRSPEARYGSEAAKAQRLHAEFAGLLNHIEYRPETLVWNLGQGAADLMHAGKITRLAYDGLILATGATDRILPFPGWTTPGVFTLGGAQIALKAQGVSIGEQVVFAGSGPLLYLVAWQYLKAGIRVAGVLDCAPFSAKFHLVKGLIHEPRTVLLGLRYAAALRLAGVPMRFGVADLAVTGDARVTGIGWQEDGRAHHLACDAIGFGLGLKPETQLTDLAGCAFAFSPRDRAHLPTRDAAGRSNVTGTYIAGDGAGIMGADAAELAGERAALALIEDRALPSDAARATVLEKHLTRMSRFRDAMAEAFPFPEDWPIADSTLLCRCEEITAGEARAAIRQFGSTEINRLKAVSRLGMGRCQGRVCGTGIAEILAKESGQKLAAVGRLRGQAPVKPVPLTLLDTLPEAAE